MEIAGITDPTTADGLKLAGIREVHEIENKEETKEVFDNMIKKSQIGIIILTEELAQEIDGEISRFREEKEGVTPIIIEIPNKEGPVPERKEIIDKLVKRAVGIKLER